jgi:hypothetical protein
MRGEDYEAIRNSPSNWPTSVQTTQKNYMAPSHPRRLVTDALTPFASQWILLANAKTLAADRGMLDELEELLEIETVSHASVNRTLTHLQCSLCNYLVTRDNSELAQTPKRRKSL